MNWLLVFVGGGLGSLARYAISLIINKLTSPFPLATLLSNVLACLIIGILTGLILRGSVGDTNRLLWATGFCGGFSTFSTFSNETLVLFQNGQLSIAFLYIILSLVLCLLGTFIGLLITEN